MVPLLIALRTFLSLSDVAGLVPAIFDDVGIAELEFACAVGSRVVFDGTLIFDGGRAGDAIRLEVDGEGRLFLVLFTGNAGRAAVGGSKGGCDGLGSAVAIVKILPSLGQKGVIFSSSSRERLIFEGTCRNKV